jgi:mannose-6-phosphate isomerase-like protein (cupin superfamily)
VQRSLTALKLSYSSSEGVAGGMHVYRLDLNPVLRVPFQSSRFVVEAGASSPLDQHLEAEIWIVVKGSGLLFQDTRSERIEAGDAVLFKPWEPHQVQNDSGEAIVVLSFWWVPEAERTIECSI